MIGSKRSFAIVASQYNQRYVEGLIKGAQKELAELSPSSTVIVKEVPGAFEIPVVTQQVLLSGSVSAVLALGVVIRGETRHAELIGRAVSDSLQRLSLEHRTPVIHEVLLVDNEEQAAARCLKPEHNRGIEAARAAVQTLQVLDDLKTRQEGARSRR